MNFAIVFALLNGLNLSIIIMNIPPVLSELMRLYGGSYTQISVLMSALLWTHAAMQLPAGMIVDRLGVHRTQILSLICLCAGNAFPAVAPDLAWGIGGRVIRPPASFLRSSKRRDNGDSPDGYEQTESGGSTRPGRNDLPIRRRFRNYHRPCFSFVFFKNRLY